MTPKERVLTAINLKKPNNCGFFKNYLQARFCYWRCGCYIFLVVMMNGLTMIGVSPSFLNLIKGSILLLILFIGVYSQNIRIGNLAFWIREKRS